MRFLSKRQLLLFAIFIAVTFLGSAQPLSGQSHPVIIATASPTPYIPPTPAPTPISNIALSYNEVRRETVGNDTRIVLAVNARYNFGGPVTLNLENFTLVIITNVTHGLPPMVFVEQTGQTNPEETGKITIDSGNSDVNFSLRYQFQTMRDTFYGEIKEFSGYDVVYTGSIEPESTSAPLNPSPTIPELSWFAILPLLIVIIVLATKLKYRRHYGKSVF